MTCFNKISIIRFELIKLITNKISELHVCIGSLLFLNLSKTFWFTFWLVRTTNKNSLYMYYSNLFIYQRTLRKNKRFVKTDKTSSVYKKISLIQSVEHKIQVLEVLSVCRHFQYNYSGCPAKRITFSCQVIIIIIGFQK